MLRFVFLTVLALVALVTGQEDNMQNMPARNSLCKSRNGYYSIEGSCDSYVECRDYQAVEMLCPDGLHYNTNTAFPDYPCGYPMDVPCLGRSPQTPISTSECPNQYGFFPSTKASPSECGLYRMCVEGRAIEMACPVGLAYNADTARCDWPDAVASCNADAYLGFKCPPAPLDESGVPMSTVINYKYEGNCYAFFSCMLGHARLLMCDAGFAFDPVSGRCVDSDRVKC